jgi:hypothetical protein
MATTGTKNDNLARECRVYLGMAFGSCDGFGLLDGGCGSWGRDARRHEGIAGSDRLGRRQTDDDGTMLYTMYEDLDLRQDWECLTGASILQELKSNPRFLSTENVDVEA